jgi:hypothetical protein
VNSTRAAARVILEKGGAPFFLQRGKNGFLLASDAFRRVSEAARGKIAAELTSGGWQVFEDNGIILLNPPLGWYETRRDKSIERLCFSDKTAGDLRELQSRISLLSRDSERCEINIPLMNLCLHAIDLGTEIAVSGAADRLITERAKALREKRSLPFGGAVLAEYLYSKGFTLLNDYSFGGYKG